jgi:hypothetical protein
MLQSNGSSTKAKQDVHTDPYSPTHENHLVFPTNNNQRLKEEDSIWLPSVNASSPTSISQTQGFSGFYQNNL